MIYRITLFSQCLLLLQGNVNFFCVKLKLKLVYLVKRLVFTIKHVFNGVLQYNNIVESLNRKYNKNRNKNIQMKQQTFTVSAGEASFKVKHEVFC